jgi:hypothetical protein
VKPLLMDLTGIMIGSGTSLILIAITARYLWRRGKSVEEP